MSDDIGPRPRLSRYNSVKPSPTGASVGPTMAGQRLYIENPVGGRASRNVSSLVPKGWRIVEHRPDGIIVEPIHGARPAPPVMGPTVRESEQYVAQRGAYGRYITDLQQWNARNIGRPMTTLNGVSVEGGEATEEQTQRINSAAEVNSIFGPLGIDSQIDPAAQFIFDRAAPLTDVGTGSRTGVLESRGMFGSADSLERQFPAGRTVTAGPVTNMMTVGAVVKWFRGLSVRDRAAYNKMVVMLRNAGYLNGSDEELPMGGYTTAAGIAIAQAANDLSQANDAGDERTMTEYLTDRGKAFEDYLAQEEADRAAEEQYQPVDRQYTDPATLRAAAYDAARAAIGRKLTPEEEERLEAAFRSKEDAAYDEIDEAGRAETSFAVAPPDVAGQVDDFLDGDEFELERKRTLIGDYANEFMRMMGMGG